MASATGIFDIRRLSWDEDLLEALGVDRSNLPYVLMTQEERRHLNRIFRRRWPLLKDAAWSPAIGDGAANNIGAGCVTRAKAALMVGTSGAMRVAYAGEPPNEIPGGLWCYRLDERRVIVGGALSDGGGLYGWLKDTLRLRADDELEREIARREPDSHGLTFLPFFFGERSTGYNESAQGALLGLRSTTDSADIAQAALEAVAYRFAEIFDRLAEACRVREIVASGGAMNESAVWPQIMADVIGRDLILPHIDEASMRGAVLLALETTGRIKKIEDVPMPDGKVFPADKTRKAAYKNARKRHQEAYRLLIDRERPE